MCLQVASLVPPLRPFFTYGLTKRPGSASTTPRRDQPWRRDSFKDAKSGSDSEGAPSARVLAQSLETINVSGDASVNSGGERARDEGAGPGPGSAATKSAYVPPHLRKAQPPLLPLPGSNGTPTKPGASFRAADPVLVSSSESEQSDSDGAGGDGDRYKASKVRIEALSCVQAIARRDPKALHSQWAALLPTQGALLTRPPTPHLLNPLLSDPLPKVRLAAVAAIGPLLEGPARAFLQAAEWKDDARARSGPFLSLSATLGLIVKQLHAGLLHSVGTERNAQVLAGAFKALALLISAAPYHRLPDDLLPDTVKQIHRKTRALLANQFAAESGGAGAAAVACLGAALGTFAPVEKVADLLITGPSDARGSKGAPSSPSPLLADLISYCQPPTAPAIALEAFAALREALRNYGARCVELWPALSTLLGGVFGGASSSVTDDRLVLGGVKMVDDFLRSISGGELDDGESGSKSQKRADLRQGSKQLPREGGGGGEMGRTESEGSALVAVASATWREVLSRHIPWLLAHQAPMVSRLHLRQEDSFSHLLSTPDESSGRAPWRADACIIAAFIQFPARTELCVCKAELHSVLQLDPQSGPLKQLVFVRVRRVAFGYVLIARFACCPQRPANSSPAHKCSLLELQPFARIVHPQVINSEVCRDGKASAEAPAVATDPQCPGRRCSSIIKDSKDMSAVLVS